MGQFAKISEENVVIHVVYIPDEYMQNENGEKSEEELSEEIALHNGGGNWIRSYEDGRKRRQPAVAGGTYDPIDDVFIDPPFEHLKSWILVNGKYVPPTPMPEKFTEESWPLEYGEYNPAHGWYWDEDSTSWIFVNY